MAECMAIEMAELIELGLEFTNRAGNSFRVEERPNAMLELVDAIYRASPLGLALIGRTGNPHVALTHWMNVSNTSRAAKFEAAAHLLGISPALARLIEINHANGLSARAIAHNLRAGTLGLTLGRKGVHPSPYKVRPQQRPAQPPTFRVGTSSPNPVALRMAASRIQ